MIKILNYVHDGIDSKITIVGTAHVSQHSVDEVTNTIKTQKPNVVAVELCENGYAMRADGMIMGCWAPKEYELKKIDKMLRGDKDD